MKKLLAVFVTLSLLCGCSSKPAPSGNTGTPSESTPGTVATPAPDVTITLSGAFLENMEQDVDSFIKETQEGNGGLSFKDVIKNDDGSVTLVMDAETNKKLMTEFKKNVDEALQQITEDESMSNIQKITYNDDVTVFNVTLENGTVGIVESISALALYVYGSMYQVFSGVPEDKIDVLVNFVDVDGNVIESGKLSDTAQQ